MRFLSSSLLLLAAAGLATPVLAQDAPAPAKPAKPKKICRVDPTTGSVMPRYVCHSKEEWAVLDKASQDASDNAQNGSTGSMLGNGGAHTAN